MHGVRARLALTVVGLVAVTSLVLGAGSYAYVATSLRSQQLDAARELTTYNVAVLAVERLPDGATRADLAASRLLDGFAARGIAGTVVDFGDGDPYASNLQAAAMAGRLSPDLVTIAARGDVAFERTTVGGTPMLVTAARRPPSGPTFYFLFDASGVEDAIRRLGQALLVGGLVLVVLAALAARFVARGLLRPVRDGAGAAERIAAGDLSARLDTASGDEFAQWAGSFNRMAASLERHVAELQGARVREQRFVADVAHELRTPLTALVAEASLLREHLDALPAAPRRIGELVAGDVGRLRVLVDDLMELSRFDAGAERLERREFDVASFVRSTVDARLPGAQVETPEPATIVATDPRRLERVLGNLLDNARIHAGGRDVEVEVGFEAGEPAAGAHPADEHSPSDALPGPDEQPATLVVAVADRGPGVPSGRDPTPVRQVPQGRPLAARRRQRARARHRPRARPAAGRNRGCDGTGRRGHAVRGARPRDTIVTRRRRAGDGRRPGCGADAIPHGVTTMNRPLPRTHPPIHPMVPAILVLAVALAAIAACAPGVGDAGPLQASGAPAGSPAAASPGPSGAPGESVSPGQSPAGSAAPPSSPGASAAPPASAAPAVTTVAVYFFRGDRLVPVQRAVPRTVAVARAALQQLLAGPTAVESAGPSGLTSTVPSGSQLLDVAIADGTATVDLSGQFESGGGSASMFGRLAQVVYTVTQFPSVTGVTFRLDGQPVTTFSSEGIVLSGPSVRADYRDYVPAIFMDAPAWGARLANPARIAGLANVFEAQFSVEISTASGAVLASRNVMASCGTGCWGTFDVTIPYAVDREQPGWVTAFDLSARDGSRENVSSYPVVLAP